MNRYNAVATQAPSFQGIELRDTGSDAVAIVTPQIGSNLLSFAVRGIPVIAPPPSPRDWHAESGYFRYGTPILFPPNRVKGGTYTYGGRTYRLPLNEPPDHHLHGELAAKAWEMVEYGADEERGAYVTCAFEMAADADIPSYFPHALRFQVTHKLRDGKMTTEISVENRSDDPAPFAFGLHPYFALTPLASSETVLTVPADVEWPVTNLAHVTGLPDETLFCRQLREGVALSAYPELGCHLIGLSPSNRVCMLEMKEAGYRIAYEIGEAFPFAVLFKPDWAPSFSIEPYTYVTDAFNLPYSDERTGARSLAPGEVVQLSTAVWLEFI